MGCGGTKSHLPVFLLKSILLTVLLLLSPLQCAKDVSTTTILSSGVQNNNAVANLDTTVTSMSELSGSPNSMTVEYYSGDDEDFSYDDKGFMQEIGLGNNRSKGKEGNQKPKEVKKDHHDEHRRHKFTKKAISRLLSKSLEALKHRASFPRGNAGPKFSSKVGHNSFDNNGSSSPTSSSSTASSFPMSSNSTPGLGGMKKLKTPRSSSDAKEIFGNLNVLSVVNGHGNESMTPMPSPEREEAEDRGTQNYGRSQAENFQESGQGIAGSYHVYNNPFLTNEALETIYEGNEEWEDEEDQKEPDSPAHSPLDSPQYLSTHQLSFTSVESMDERRTNDHYDNFSDDDDDLKFYKPPPKDSLIRDAVDDDHHGEEEGTTVKHDDYDGSSHHQMKMKRPNGSSASSTICCVPLSARGNVRKLSEATKRLFCKGVSVATACLMGPGHFNDKKVHSNKKEEMAQHKQQSKPSTKNRPRKNQQEHAHHQTNGMVVVNRKGKHDISSLTNSPASSKKTTSSAVNPSLEKSNSI